jgi:hypothetical protein
MELKIKPGALVLAAGVAGLWATKPAHSSFHSYFQSWLREQINWTQKNNKKYARYTSLCKRSFVSKFWEVRVTDEFILRSTASEEDFSTHWHRWRKEH